MYGLTSTCPTKASASRVLSMVAYVLRQWRTMSTLDVCRPSINRPSRDCCSMEVIPAMRCQNTTNCIKNRCCHCFFLLYNFSEKHNTDTWRLFRVIGTDKKRIKSFDQVGEKLFVYQLSLWLTVRHLQVWLCRAGACLCFAQRETEAGWILLQSAPGSGPLTKGCSHTQTRDHSWGHKHITKLSKY